MTQEQIEIVKRETGDARGPIKLDDFSSPYNRSYARQQLAAALESLLAEREELIKDKARLLETVRLAKREIITLTENATDLIRLHRGDCDDAEKTYGPTIARIDAAMKGEA